ncbi:GNAT family N-acetyltransferase [Microbacterium sp.]|uniref:GNAT family N-acetyltransferase n=1 Tax=Microbacterium sp. TaxID=51671 RepID=UPI0039E5EBA9
MSEQLPLSARVGEPVEPPLPRHPDVAVWRTATPADIDAIHAVMVAAEKIDHPTWTSPREEVADTFDLPHIDPSRDTIIGWHADGRPVAFGSAFLHPAREGTLTVHLFGAVLPELWRRGIGTQVQRWLVARALQQLAEVAPTLPALFGRGEWEANLKVYADEVNLGIPRLAEQAGFAPERWFTSMLRDLAGEEAEAVPTLAAPDGMRVVEYTHDRDEDARLARNDAFRDHWGSLPSAPETWAKFVGGEFFRADLSRLVLDADGAIAAFCLASVNEDDWESLGASNAYIDLIGVVRAHRRRGLAPLAISGTLQAIADAGLEKAVLDVDTASPTGAHTLYEGLGFRATERSVAFVRHV